MSQADGVPATTSPRPDDAIHLFVYGTLRSGRGATSLLDSCERVTNATVLGTLYGLDGHPALMLYGTTPVLGEVWRCPADLIWRLDEYEGVASGLFRRIGIEVAGLPCWTYVAGPRIAHELTPERRIASGDWRPDVA